MCEWVDLDGEGEECWIMRGAVAMCNTERSNDNVHRFMQHWRWLKYYSTNSVAVSFHSSFLLVILCRDYHNLYQSRIFHFHS